MDNDDSASGGTAAIYTFGIGISWVGGAIVCRARAAAAAHDDVANETRIGRATKAIAKRCSIPGVAAIAATTAVAAAATSRVLTVTNRIGIGAATTQIGRAHV